LNDSTKGKEDRYDDVLEFAYRQTLRHE